MARAIPSNVSASALSIDQVNALYDAIAASSTILLAPMGCGKTTSLHYLLHRWLLRVPTLIPYVYDPYLFSASVPRRASWCGLPVFYDSTALTAQEYPCPSVLSAYRSDLDAWLDPVYRLLQFRQGSKLEDDPLYDVSTHARRPVAVVVDVYLPILQARFASYSSTIDKLKTLIVRGHSQNIFVYLVANVASKSEMALFGLQQLNIAIRQSDKPNSYPPIASHKGSVSFLPPAPISTLEELHLPELSIAWHQAATPALDAQRFNSMKALEEFQSLRQEIPGYVSDMIQGQKQAEAIISHIENDRSVGVIESVTAYRDPEAEVELALVEHSTSGYCYVASVKFWETLMNLKFPVCASGYAKLEKALNVYRDVKGFNDASAEQTRRMLVNRFLECFNQLSETQSLI